MGMERPNRQVNHIYGDDGFRGQDFTHPRGSSIKPSSNDFADSASTYAGSIVPSEDYGDEVRDSDDEVSTQYDPRKSRRNLLSAHPQDMPGTPRNRHANAGRNEPPRHLQHPRDLVPPAQNNRASHSMSQFAQDPRAQFGRPNSAMPPFGQDDASLPGPPMHTMRHLGYEQQPHARAPMQGTPPSGHHPSAYGYPLPDQEPTMRGAGGMPVPRSTPRNEHPHPDNLFQD